MTQCVEMIKINPADYAVRLHTTLNRLHEAGACADGYRHLVECLGGVSFDHNAPINLLTILEHNGTTDCLWALRATIGNCDQVTRLMAADFAAAWAAAAGDAQADTIRRYLLPDAEEE